jgi:hypothetical protein
MRIQATEQSAKVALQGAGETALTILYRTSGTMPEPTALRGRSTKGNLKILPTATRGMWQAQIALDGPDQMDVEIQA